MDAAVIAARAVTHRMPALAETKDGSLGARRGGGFGCPLPHSGFNPENQHSPVPTSLAVLEQVPVHDTQQWILIRSESATNPVVLFVHGGPGTSWLTLMRKNTQPLEKYFTVVNWDQRRAGKSFAAGQDAAMTMGAFVGDLIALASELATGALDLATGVVVLDAINRVATDLSTTTVVITHNASVADMADRVVTLADGVVTGERRNVRRVRAQDLHW